MKTLLKWTGGILLILALVGASFYSLNEKGYFNLDDVHIDVKTYSSQKKYIEPKLQFLNARMAQFKGAPMYSLPLQQVATLLKNEKWIQNFQISRQWPSELVIQIEPVSVPMIILNPEAGSSVTTFSPVAFDGQILPRITSSQAPHTIVVTDSSFAKNKSVREGALKLIEALPQNGKLHRTQVAELGFDSKEGYWVKLVEKNTKILFGSDQFEIKSARVSQVLEYLSDRQLEARVIDANLSKKVLVRMH